jgi:tetratricopeptide (TPR) repeat protein/transglutaminase-like putative cysteine protease
MIRFLLAVVLMAFSIGTARAGDDILHFASQPEWVTTVAAPAAKPIDGAITFRLMDFQVRFDDRGTHTFARQLVRINSPEGLLAAGNVGLAWQPAFGGATVHRVVIHRGTETIDVLKDGKGFQILRREAGLESLMITGILTAIFQVPDLRVGDELEVAYTIDSNNPVLAGHVESILPLTKMPPVDRMALRYSWPVGRAVKWAAGPLVPKGVLTRQGGWQTLALTRDGWLTPDIPAGAPGRFYYGGVIQVADFADWAQVAETMRPLYIKAATIGADSPVMAEVKRIAALSPDLKMRAGEALRVVQSQVRYLARVDGLGNYTPENADVVWTGKSGDCKGKTVLLLAMLRALGITAEPALVSATDGDGLDGSLPMPGRFNHVLVRATIDGKVYWLDGTRLGDRGVETIAVPGFKWALPLEDAKPALAALAATEPSLPDTEYRLDLDARDGLTKPAKASGSVIYRGETGSRMRLSLSVIAAAKRDELLHSMWTDRYSWIDLDKVDYAIDDKTGDVSMSFTGKAKMTWASGGLDSAQRYEADYSQLGRDISPKRDKDVNGAPVAVDGDYTLNRETILLPDNGKGFSIEGDSFDKVVGGIHYVRTAALKDGRFEMSAAASNKPFEISYAAAKDADKLTDGLYARELFIRAPADYEMGSVTPDPKAPAAATDPADTSLGEISRLAVAGKNEDALKLVDTRIAGGEKGAPILAMRGQLLGRLSRTKEADAAYDQALATDRRDPTALLGKAQMLVDAGRLEDSLILYDRLILLRPDSTDAYRKRGQVRFDLGDSIGAMSDAAILIAKVPDDYWARSTRAFLYLEQDKPTEALAETHDLLKLKPNDGDAHWLQGYVLAAMGKRADALAELDRAIAIEPKSGAYYVKLNFDLEKDDQTRLADMLELIKLDPSSDVPAPALRRLLANPASRSAIVAAYDTAVDANGDDEDVANERDLMAAIGGDPKAYVARGDTLLAKKPDDADRLNDACWRRAMFKVELEAATAQCDKAIAKDRTAQILDSRGLVWLQRGDWAKAAADYGDAVATRPRLASSLYGRGLARARLGQAAAGKADMAAAARIDPRIADNYLGYGLKP